MQEKSNNLKTLTFFNINKMTKYSIFTKYEAICVLIGIITEYLCQIFLFNSNNCLICKLLSIRQE